MAANGNQDGPAAPGLNLLCDVSIFLAEGAPLDLGATPWRRRRVSDIGGGRFHGPRLRGTVRASGADWSEGGAAADGGAATLIDVRSLWQTDDGALIHVSYQGRLIIPKPLLGAFRDPAQLDALDPDSYYFRTVPVFETSAQPYAWLNELVAVAVGRRTAAGVDYRLFQVE